MALWIDRIGFSYRMIVRYDWENWIKTRVVKKEKMRVEMGVVLFGRFDCGYRGNKYRPVCGISLRSYNCMWQLHSCDQWYCCRCGLNDRMC
jgi:hypothetical protein